MNEKSARPASPRPGSWVLVFFASFFLLFCSGRLSSGDANYQLRTAMLMATTHSFGQPTQVDGGAWVPAPNGWFYEPHDIGNSVLMLPAATLSLFRNHVPTSVLVVSPPLVAKLGVSLTYAVFTTIGCYYMYLLFALYNSHRIAFYLSVAFVVTTPFWAISRSAWDVLGGADGAAIFLWAMAKIWLDPKPTRSDVILLAAGLAIAASFRYSVLPFFGLGGVIVIGLRRKSLNLPTLALGAVVFALLISPNLYYNHLRMGSPFLPATASKQLLAGGMNNMSGHYWQGLYGLYLSPNWGLLWFSPEFILLLALPFMFGKLDPKVRGLALICAVSVAGYSFFIASIDNWHGQLGWGSRYIIPELPLLFFMVSVTFPVLWKSNRPLLITLLALSCLLQIPSGFINWQQSSLDTAVVPYEAQIRYKYALAPRQQIAAWKGFLGGLAGKDLPAASSWNGDPVLRSLIEFPDIFIARVIRQSKVGTIVGSGTMILLIGLMIASLRQIIGGPDSVEPLELAAIGPVEAVAGND